MEAKRKGIFILISGIIGLFTIINFALASWIFGILAIIFGYKNRENTLAKTGLILGILTILILIFIKIILPLSTGVAAPLVIFESCSMSHNQKGFSEIFESQVYSDNSITLSDSQNWNFQNGINKGDVIFITSPKNIEVGDIILFNAGNRFPLLHRVVSLDPIMTKGDNPKTNSLQLPHEKNIPEDQIIGKASLRIPLIGWSKLIFNDFRKSPRERGFC